jgi:hypothetical protein
MALTNVARFLTAQWKVLNPCLMLIWDLCALTIDAQLFDSLSLVSPSSFLSNSTDPSRCAN